jgi:hypothetical protein
VASLRTLILKTESVTAARISTDSKVNNVDLAGHREAASGAEGQVAWVGPSPQVPGGRSVSFLVSFMYVYLRPLPSTTGR